MLGPQPVPPGPAGALLSLLPPDVVVTDADVMSAYSRDHSRFTDHALPVAVLMPRTTAEVSLCLRTAQELGVAVVPRGAGSGLSGGANAVPGSVVLSLHRMRKILDLDPGDRLAVVQPGVITADLRAAASAAGLFYPPDPGSVAMCTIGGNAATNAGGMCCVKYGVTGDFVIGLEVVLADGQVMRTGRRTIKGVAGYDLTHLFVGSEGTLGVITEVTVRLMPAPPPARTLVASFADLRDAGAAVAAITRTGPLPSLMELLDRTTLRAVDGLTGMDFGDEVAALLLVQSDVRDDEALAALQATCRGHRAIDLALSSDETEAALLLEARRLALPALERLGDCLLDDVAVPPSKVVELIAAIEEISERLGVSIGVFGHAGDGNMHPTIIHDSADPRSRSAALVAFDEVTAAALRLGGTVTGEHGVGRLKTRWLAEELDAPAHAVHAALKSALDPLGTLNPGAGLPTA